jgi:hypothetical protein
MLASATANLRDFVPLPRTAVKGQWTKPLSR